MVTRTAAAWRKMNEPVVAEFRAHGGQVSRKYPVLLLTTVGAVSGQPRVTPLNYTVDGDRVAVIASAGGSPTDPAWYRNLVAHPEVTIELGGERFAARAITASEPERTRLFDQQAAEMPFFNTYRRQVTTREIPVVIFERLAGRPPS